MRDRRRGRYTHRFEDFRTEQGEVAGVLSVFFHGSFVVARHELARVGERRHQCSPPEFALDSNGHAVPHRVPRPTIAEEDAALVRNRVVAKIASLVAPGIQGLPGISQAIAMSRRANDYLAEHIAKYPKRLKGFAALPLQDPQAAAQELTRCVKELGFCGALVHGFSQIREVDSAVYYDLPQYRSFWATVQELDVPFYRHPRAPLATRQQAYEGHPWLIGATWGFAVETSIHALRLMGSGLFDEYPKLKVILGHLGEGVPFNIWRVDHTISTVTSGTKAILSMGQYLRENFYITTSGNFRTQALTDVMLEVGADRVLYSVDYPFEDMAEAATWFDQAAISEPDRLKIARSNAQKLFHF